MEEGGGIQDDLIALEGGGGSEGGWVVWRKPRVGWGVVDDNGWCWWLKISASELASRALMT